MSIPFKSPSPRHTFRVTSEKKALDQHFRKRKVQRSGQNRLLLASWNIANLGAQSRTKEANQLIAHILKRFDLVAVQEVNEQYGTLEQVMGYLGSGYEFIMTDTAGNDERLAYVYKKAKVKPRNLFGELALRPSEYPKRTVTVHYKYRNREYAKKYPGCRFVPFDRNPFIGSFQAGNLDFTLVNVHLYYGAKRNSRHVKDHKKYCRRVMEIYALSKWADRRRKRKSTYDQDIILLGDMNIPEMKEKDAAYKALVAFGMQPVKHPLDNPSKTGGTNIRNDKAYDQISFAPGTIKSRVKKRDIFDFDNAIFKPLWDKLSAGTTTKKLKNKAVSKFLQHVKHHISDHRPLWVELDIS